MNPASPTDKPARTLAQALGHEPTRTLRRVLALLHNLPRDEMHWLKMEGIRREQLSRVETSPSNP